MKKIIFFILALFVVFAFAQDDSKPFTCEYELPAVYDDVNKCLQDYPALPNGTFVPEVGRCPCYAKYTTFFTEHPICEHNDTLSATVFDGYTTQCVFNGCDGCLSWAFHAAAPAFVAIVAIIALLF